MSSHEAFALGDFSESIDYGVTASASRLPVGPKFLRITDIQDGRVDWERVPQCECDERSATASALLPGDIVFARTGATTGKSFLIRECPANAVFASYLIRVRVGESADPRFVSHFFQTPEYWSQIAKSARGAAQPGVNATVLKSITVPLPSLSEQRRIADILDKADALRAQRRVALAELDTLTQSIFLDLFGDPKSNPNTWPQKAMAELFAASPIFGTMIPPVTEKREWLSLRVRNIQDWVLDLSDSKYVDLPSSSVERHSVKDGDLLLARAIASQDHLGKCVVAYPNGQQWAFDSHLMRLRFDLKRIEPEFIRHLFMTVGGRSLFLRASRRSTVQFNINTKEISTLQIPVPPVELQRQFVHRVRTAEKLKAAHRTALAEFDTLFASLQHRAFTGAL